MVKQGLDMHVTAFRGIPGAQVPRHGTAAHVVLGVGGDVRLEVAAVGPLRDQRQVARQRKHILHQRGHILELFQVPAAHL